MRFNLKFILHPLSSILHFKLRHHHMPHGKVARQTADAVGHRLCRKYAAHAEIPAVRQQQSQGHNNERLAQEREEHRVFRPAQRAERALTGILERHHHKAEKVNVQRRNSRRDQFRVLIENADEPYAEEIADAVVTRQKRGEKIVTTKDLQRVIEEALSFLPKGEQKEAVKKSCQRTFQALRIDVNQEYEVLYEFLEKLPRVLASGGRVAILTFHSGEDRLVKKSFKRFLKEGEYAEVSKDVIRPSQEECVKNPRARSTKMRWAIKA